MRNTFYKFMPLVFGVMLGWMLFNPPAWLESLGVLAYGINLLICAVLMLSLVALVIVANLPAKLVMDPIGAHEVPPELRAYGDRLQQLGFRAAGPPRRVNVAPAATLLGFVHESEPVYATVFRTDTVPPKTCYDFVSILHGEKGALTTNAEPGGAVLPAGDGGLRQVLPGESLENMYQRHLEGVRYLHERGLQCHAVSTDMLPRDFAEAMARQRRLFLSSPLSGSLVTLWRAATKKVPFIGLLREQKIAQQQISRLLTS